MLTGKKLLMAVALSIGAGSPCVTALAANYSWLDVATNVTYLSYSRPGENSGIVYANNQMALSGRFVLKSGSIANAPIAGFVGDGNPGKSVKLSVTSDGYYQLQATSGNDSTVYSQVSSVKATEGLHRFALLMRRGDGASNTQQMKYAAAIIDGATTLEVVQESVNYSTGPIRSAYFGGEGYANTVSGSIWTADEAASSDLSLDSGDELLKVEADAAETYPIAENSSVAWSNLDDATSPKAYYFTKASTLQLTPITGVKSNRRVILTAVKFHYNSSDAMSDTLTVNGIASETKECTTIDEIAGTANNTSYTFNQLVTYTFPVGRRPVVTVGTGYDIASTKLPAIQTDSPILISGLTGNWANFNAYCAVEGLAALEPEATVASVEATASAGFAGGGTVAVTLERLFSGTYADEDLSFVLRFDGMAAEIVGERSELALNFELPAADFLPGNVYRGELVLVYPDGEQSLASVKVYEGHPTLVTESGWVNETSATLGSTGTWTAPEGIAPYQETLEVDANGGVSFAPTGAVDYVESCDSTWQVSLLADEAFAADDAASPAAGTQGAVRIAEVDGALKVQVWADGAWATLCDAVEGETCTVTVDFHYAKSENESDTVTYTCGTATLSGTRPENSAQYVTAVSASDGTQLVALTAERELDCAQVNQVTVAPGGAVQDLGDGELPDRIRVEGVFGYGKHALLTYSGAGDLASLPVDGLPATAAAYIEEGENGVKTWGVVEKTLVIYPVGDSITYGASRRLKTPANVDIAVPGGYRLPLYTRLTGVGYTVQYVGDTNSNPAEGLGTQLYHSGHAGWKVDDGDSIYASVSGWASTVKTQAGRDPDVILLLLGVNDINGGEAPATTAEQMQKLVWRLAGIGPAVDGDTPLYPNAKLLLAKVLDSTYATSSVNLETLSTRIGEYNTALETFVNGLTAEQGKGRIRLVDLNMPLDEEHGFNYFRYDNLHPAAEGYTQMARSWFAAVEDFLPPLNLNESAMVRVAESVVADQITLAFSKAMGKEAAETAGNYTLSSGTVAAAKLLDDGLAVVLTIEGATPGADATLAVAAMDDKAGVQSTETALSVRIGAKAARSTDIADSVCNRTADGYTNPLELIAEWSAFTAAPTAEAGLPAQFGAARRAERPWVLKTLRGAPTVEDGALCLNGGTVTVEVNPDFTASQSGHYWTLIVETVDEVGENTVLGTMRTSGGTDAFADLYGLRTGTAGTVVTVNAGVDAAVSGFADVSASAVDYSRKRNQFVTSFGTGGYFVWVNGKAVAFDGAVSALYYSGKTPLNFTFGGTYLTTAAEAAAFTQGSNLKITRIAICIGRATGDILTSSRYRFDPAGTDTNWSTLANWRTYGDIAGDCPSASETAYIAPGVTATMDRDATVGNLVAEGALTVDGANALTVLGRLLLPDTLTVNAAGGVSVNSLVTSGERTLAGTGALAIAAADFGGPFTVSGNLVWNANGETIDTTVKVTAAGSLTTVGNLTLSSGANELLGTTTVQSGTLTAKTGSQKIGGTFTIAKDGAFVYGQANVADALNYSGSATVNVYGALDLNNTRWSLGSNNTLNFYPGATVNAGLQSNDYGALDVFGSAKTLNFLADDGNAKGGEIAFDATLRARQPITLNVADGVTVNFSGGRSKDLVGDSGDTQAIAKTGAGLMKVACAMRFDGVCSGPLQVLDGGALKLTAAGNATSPVTVDGNARLVLDCATASSGTGNLNNKSVIANNGTVELANGYSWIHIDGGKTEVTGSFTFGFGIAGMNDNVFKTDLEVADGATLKLCGHRNTSAELTNLKNLGAIQADKSAATATVGIALKSGATVSGSGTIGVPVTAAADVTLDASEVKALNFANGLTLAGSLAVKAADARADLCTIGGTVPDVTAFVFAGDSAIADGYCLVLLDGTRLQALPKVALPEGSEQSDSLSEAITRALQDKVGAGATTVGSLIATEAGGTEANDKRSTEAAELFTNVVTAETIGDTGELAVKVAYDFNVAEMKMPAASDGSENILLCVRVSNVPPGSDVPNSAGYAKGTVVRLYRNDEASPFAEAGELSAAECEELGVTCGQGEKWFAVPFDANAGQATTFVFSAAKETDPENR